MNRQKALRLARDQEAFLRKSALGMRGSGNTSNLERIAIDMEERANAIRQLLADKAELVAALEEVREACLFDEDDGRIGVTEDPSISLEQFDRICVLINRHKEG